MGAGDGELAPPRAHHCKPAAARPEAGVNIASRMPYAMLPACAIERTVWRGWTLSNETTEADRELARPRARLSSLPCRPQSLFHVYNTPSYALHLFEAPTGLKFILLTSPGLDSKLVRSALRTMWSPNGAYGLWVVGNPEKGSGKDEKEGLDSE